MSGKQKGFTLVEVIVALVILAILASIMIPAMAGWIDRANEKRLIVACRTCVNAAQALASEAYGVNGKSTPPTGSAVVALAGVKGIASNISLDASSAAVDTLTYSEDSESMTYMRMPFPQYVIGTGLAKEMSAASNWAQNYKKTKPDAANEFLTINYGNKSALPSPLNDEQVASIFGDLKPQDGSYYIYPMAIYDANGMPLNVMYVTQHNPQDLSGPNRYQAAAFIIDGKTYISTAKKDDMVTYRLGGEEDFQTAMNKRTFDSTQDFVDFITDRNYYAEA